MNFKFNVIKIQIILKIHKECYQTLNIEQLLQKIRLFFQQTLQLNFQKLQMKNKQFQKQLKIPFLISKNLGILKVKMFERRRTEITISTGIIRKAKGLIGQLIPKIPNLAAQTTFAKEGISKEFSNQDFIEEFTQIHNQAEEQLGEGNAFSLILDSFVQLPEQVGNLEHITYVVDMLANMQKRVIYSREQNLQDTNIILFNSEQQRQELHDRIIEHVQQKQEKLSSQIEEFQLMISQIEQQITDLEDEIQAELENQDDIQKIEEDYIDAHEINLHTHDQNIKENIQRIKMIRLLKSDFFNDFEGSSRYILSQRFHFTNI